VHVGHENRIDEGEFAVPSEERLCGGKIGLCDMGEFESRAGNEPVE
jgi:hypothetical protein